MKLAGSYTVGAPRELVFAAITDPAVLEKVIDGCEKMVQTGEGTYDAHLKIGIAGLKGRYVGKIQMKDIHAPVSYTLIVEGKGAGSFVKGTARIRLREKADATELHCDADGQVGGMIAAVGSRLIDVTAKKMMDEFFHKFAAEVTTA